MKQIKETDLEFEARKAKLDRDNRDLIDDIIEADAKINGVNVGQLPNNSKKIEPPKKKEYKDLEPVVKNTSTRKPSLMSRFTQNMLGDSFKNVCGYVLTDILVPSAKDLLSDIITGGSDRWLYGENARRGTRARGAGPTNYNKVYNSGVGSRQERVVRNTNRIKQTFEDIEFFSRSEAEDVLCGLQEQINEADTCRVADFLVLSGRTPDAVDHEWGWDNIDAANVIRCRNGKYIITMPRTIQLR